MRRLLLASLVALLVLTPAFAAPGYKARVTTTIAISDAFFKALGPGMSGAIKPGSFTIPPVTGMLYVSGKARRLDMNAPGGTMTSLFDTSGNGYMLDAKKQVAWKLPKPQAKDGDLPLFNLDQMASNWPAISARMKALPGIKSTELGAKKIDGQACHGMKMTGDIRKLLSADGVQIAPGMPTLQNMKGNWSGTVWVHDKLGLPLRMTSSYSGITINWQLSGLKSAAIPDSMLKLPPGYAVKDSPKPQ